MVCSRNVRYCRQQGRGALQVMTAFLIVLKLVSSFQVSPFVVPGRISATRPNRLALMREEGHDFKDSIHFQTLQRTLQQRTNHRRSGKYLELLSSLSSDGGINNEKNEDDEEDDEEEVSWEDDLSKLLSSRGEMKGSSRLGGQRRRTRERIREWMGIGAVSGSGTSSTSPLVQPIRLEDGRVVERPTDGQAQPTQAKFDQLFDGMPSLNEILSGTDPASEVGSGGGTSQVDKEGKGKKKDREPSDDSWFEEEKQKLEEEYQEVLEDMRAELKQQQLEDPDSVPQNADGVLEAIIWQDMKRTIAAVKLQRAKERLQDYEINKKSDLDAKDLNGVTDELVEEMLKEAAKDWERREAAQAEVDDFKRYEDDAFQASIGSADGTSNSDSAPQPGENLDEWALQTLEDMLKDKQMKGDDSGMISDTLEENIEELRERLGKVSKQGSIQPQSMKEWQMYRAIATRLGSRQEGSSEDKIQPSADEDDEQIAAQLESWKQYLGKEEDMRQKSGLSKGPQMPFDWQDAKKSPLQVLEDSSPPRPIDPKRRREMRREVNLQAIKAMEDLVNRSDPVRAESLRKVLEELKVELEPRDYNDTEEEITDEELDDIGPIDLSGVFRSGRDKEVGEEEDDHIESYDATSFNYESPVTSSFAGSGSDFKQPSSKTASFTSSDFDSPEKKPAGPPKTAFFSEDLEEDDSSSSYDAETPTTNKLGTVNEQKLQAMYRRAGAWTEESQKEIRDQWESFQSFEKERRDQSGLSDGDGSDLMDRADLKYDISEVMKADGDVDAEKILATIGPRPVRKSRGSSPSAPKVGNDELSSSDDNPPANTTLPVGGEDEGWKATENALKSGLDPKEVSDSLYRSVSAVGGGRTKDDPEARAKEKADYEEFMKKEDELRRSLDDLDEDAAKKAASIEGAVDSETYAKDALSSLGPRPTFKRTRKQVMDEGEYSDQGGALSKEDDSDSTSLDDEEDETLDGDESSDSFAPQWLKKEREQSKKKDPSSSSGRGGFLGSDIDEVFDDDKYDTNLRQLAEYERRRSGEKGKMTIDISDVLGRRAPGSDDYADYNYDDNYFRGNKGGWGSSSFEARKANLLEYTELSAIELNNLMDFKDSVHATGVSQYLPRINKPFKEFGAVFRLEGVFVDITGLQDQAWKKVATSLGFRQPQLDEIQRAAVVRPDKAVRDIFYWTSDVIECKNAVEAHRMAVGELFDEWAQEAGIGPPPTSPPLSKDEGQSGASMALGSEIVSESPSPPMPLDEETKLNLLGVAWTKTAEEFGFLAPTTEQVVQCSMLSPDIAVREVFRWSYEMKEIDKVVSVYTQKLQELSGKSSSAEDEAAKVDLSSAASLSSQLTDENAVLELQYLAWKKVAEENGFEAPIPEEVLAASVLNDPEAVVRGGFGWTDDSTKISALARRYWDLFAELVNDRVHNRSVEVPPPSSVDVKTIEMKEESKIPNGPTPEEILEIHVHAWSVASATHQFKAPSPDQIELTLNMGVSETVRLLLAWTYNFNDDQIKSISATYENALIEASQKFIGKYNMKAEGVAPPPKPPPKVESKPPNGDELFQAMSDAWSEIARQRGYSLPDQEQIQFAMAVGPEEGIITGFQWTDDRAEAANIAQEYKSQIGTKRQQWQNEGATMNDDAASIGILEGEGNLPFVKAVPDVEEWVKSLRDVDMECGVVSFLNQDQLAMLLDYAGLANYFPPDKRVSSSNGYDRESQQLLGAALRIERRPDHCVVFDSSPYANDAAGQVDMRSVAIVGAYPRYELLTADSSAASFDELTAMNIRRLFGERVYDQPMLDLQPKQPDRTKKVKTQYWDDE